MFKLSFPLYKHIQQEASTPDSEEKARITIATERSWKCGDESSVSRLDSFVLCSHGVDLTSLSVSFLQDSAASVLLWLSSDLQPFSFASHISLFQSGGAFFRSCCLKATLLISQKFKTHFLYVLLALLNNDWLFPFVFLLSPILPIHCFSPPHHFP